MAERRGKKGEAKRRAEKSREKVISSFVVISIVLSVLAASVATVSAPNGGVPPPDVTEIVVTANPKSIPADGSSTSTITATVTNWTDKVNKTTPDGFKIYFEIIKQPGGASISPTFAYTDINGNASTTLKAGNKSGIVTIAVKAWQGWELKVFNTTNVTLNPPPEIVAHAPESPVKDNEGAARTFSITVNQPAKVTWLINGTVKQINESVPAYTPCNYTNESAVGGCMERDSFR